MMKMLKKHYEKFLFIFLLLIFLLLFGFQVLSLSDEKQEDKIPAPRRDYQRVDFSNDKYDSEKLFQNVSGNISLKKSASANAASKDAEMYSEIDMLAPPKLARCPVDGQEHLIPITDFPADNKEIGKKKCSSCNAPLNYVPPELYNLSETAQSLKDTDQDGIPDDEEKKAGLNPQNPNDATQDLDKDGFTNLEEFRLGTMINNPKSRPSYATKLLVKEINETPIGIKVARFLNDNDEKNTEKWTVQLASETVIKRKNAKGKDRKVLKTFKVRVGRELKKAGTDGHTYVVERIIPKFGDKDGNRENISTVVLKRVDTGEQFSAAKGQDFIDPKKQVLYECQLPESLTPVFNKEAGGIYVKIGEEFKIGNGDTGMDVFSTVSAEKHPDAQNAVDRMKAKVQQKTMNNASVYFDVKTRSEYGNNAAPEENQGSIPQF